VITMNKLFEWTAVLALLATTGSAATADAPIRITETPVIQYEFAAPATSLLDKLDDFAHLKIKINSLETTVETKDKQLYIVKAQKELALEAQIDKYVDIDVAISDLYQYVGKTPYVLGARTTSAWDCSGLTRWFYETNRGMTLEHSATSQKNLGTKVDAPIPGDIVAFTHPLSKNAYHVGIYIGGGKMIHALNVNKDTLVDDVDAFADSENSRVAYIRY
jgi:cell wall-associated NlpC family hydrolase